MPLSMDSSHMLDMSMPECMGSSHMLDIQRQKKEKDNAILLEQLLASMTGMDTHDCYMARSESFGDSASTPLRVDA